MMARMLANLVVFEAIQAFVVICVPFHLRTIQKRRSRLMSGSTTELSSV